MQTVLTITSKGQTTIPIAMRRRLGLTKSGGILSIYLDERKGTAIITKPLSIEELSQHVSQNIEPGTKPVLNVDEYYQEHRRVNH
ncbi:MAG TPA: AbrB/MazE/SpoVT family DNA-binding domain-containing protein [Candidatus Binatia bacterium]|nr:AbrB/MazE/SpoVT family DNA-binding domain-containing protein [Candidatus Binatia bacterium]